MIKIENLTKTYIIGETRFKALNDVSLAIENGEFVAIQGKSGAGKSTLLHILGCVDNFDKGKYYFKDIDVDTLNDSKKSKLRNEEIGFVLQDFSLINHKDVLFNVMLPLFFNRTPSKKMKEMAYDALEIVGIQDQAGKKANQLSGGQRQRVAIARAIVNNPSLLLADEPTGALDSNTSAQIMDQLIMLNKKGITVILVTHDDTVADKCNRKIIINDGKII